MCAIDLFDDDIDAVGTIPNLIDATTPSLVVVVKLHARASSNMVIHATLPLH